MYIDINYKDYREFNTPYIYSYSLDTSSWYKDEDGIMPEPETQPKIIDKFIINDILGDSFNSQEENEKEFQEFIAYNFGVENGCDCFGFAILNISQIHDNSDDLEIGIDMCYFDDILEFAQEIEQGKNSCRYLESYSCAKLFGWQKDNNKVRFAIQNYVLHESYKSDFIFYYDVLVDKTQLVSELKRVANKYIKLAITAIKKYEKDNFARFTNIRREICLEQWLNLKDGTYNDWKAKKFITATELEEFINKLKPKIIDKPINNIIITGNLFNCCNEITECNFDKIEEYCAELDEPAIIKVGEDIQFEIDFQEHSLVQIGINSLKENDFKSSFGYPWRDISNFYKKNIIGHKIKDIYIGKTKQLSISWQVKRNEGDDMYDEISFILDNGYKLKINCFTDYMNIAEINPKNKEG